MPAALATTREEASQLNQLAIGALDSDLIAYFNAQRPAFENLAAFLPAFEAAGPNVDHWIRAVDQQMDALLRPLGDPQVTRHNGDVLIMWGGINVGGGGFIKASAEHPPTLTIERMALEQGEMIWIEPVTDGWYFVRTSYIERILRGPHRTPILRLQSQPTDR